MSLGSHPGPEVAAVDMSQLLLRPLTSGLLYEREVNFLLVESLYFLETYYIWGLTLSNLTSDLTIVSFKIFFGQLISLQDTLVRK